MSHYFKREYPLAYEAFKEATEKCSRGNMLDACAYWKGLVQEKLGNSSDAADCYWEVIRKFDHTYYSYRARDKLAELGRDVKDDSDYQSTGLPVVGEEEFADVPFTEEPLPFDDIADEHSSTESGATANRVEAENHFGAYSELMAMGFYDDAAREADLMIKYSDDSKKTSAKLALASADLAAGKVRESILFAETLCNNSIAEGSSKQLPRETWQLAYPLGYYNHVAQYAAQFGIDENLVLAVIREESRFNPRTVSWANARGLMQLIPHTGLIVARLIGLRPYYTNRLHDPDINIKMGCYYLSQLLKRFNGNKVLAVAAYNGGPVRVQKWYRHWQAQTGDVDMDEFVESIPLSETRRYVQKVMKSYNEYKRLYTNRYPIITTKS